MESLDPAMRPGLAFFSHGCAIPDAHGHCQGNKIKPVRFRLYEAYSEFTDTLEKIDNDQGPALWQSEGSIQAGFGSYATLKEDILAIRRVMRGIMVGTEQQRAAWETS